MRKEEEEREKKREQIKRSVCERRETLPSSSSCALSEPQLGWWVVAPFLFAAPDAPQARHTSHTRAHNQRSVDGIMSAQGAGPLPSVYTLDIHKSGRTDWRRCTHGGRRTRLFNLMNLRDRQRNLQYHTRARPNFPHISLFSLANVHFQTLIFAIL